MQTFRPECSVHWYGRHFRCNKLLEYKDCIHHHFWISEQQMSHQNPLVRKKSNQNWLFISQYLLRLSHIKLYFIISILPSLISFSARFRDTSRNQGNSWMFCVALTLFLSGLIGGDLRDSKKNKVVSPKMFCLLLLGHFNYSCILYLIQFEITYLVDEVCITP